MCLARLVALCLLLATTGCSTYSLQELKTATPRGTPFQAALSVRYMRLADEKAHKYNWIDSDHFADKGLRSAYGHDVEPEDPARWDIPGGKRAEIESAHKALLQALTLRVAHPDDAAAAQVFFDCWVQNQDANWQPDEIAWCRDNFAAAMQRLKGAPQAEAKEAAKEQVKGPDAAPDVVGKTAYIVFFGMNCDSLDEPGDRVIDGVVSELKKEKGNYTIILNGHADTVGDKRYNFDLSRRRAQSVEAALAERGISKTHMRPFAFGDTDPKVETGPDVAEPKNRRVEIYIGDE